MIDTVLIVVICVTIIILFLFWYARYSTKSNFSIDQNKNDIPDSWEKRYGIFFKLKNIIILILGILIGYLLNHSSFL